MLEYKCLSIPKFWDVLHTDRYVKVALSVFNLEGAMGPLTLFSIKWPLATAEWAIFNIVWMGKYLTVFYFRLKSNDGDPF